MLISIDALFLVTPAFSCIAMVLWLGMTIWRRDQKIPFFDVGIFCALSTLVYTVYPLANYWLDGYQFGLLSDIRLKSFNISPYELGFFHLRHTLYLFSFVVFYKIFRGKGAIETGNIENPNRITRQLIVLFFFFLTAYFFFLELVSGVSYSTSYAPEEFDKNVEALSRLPLVILQISSKLWGFLFVLKLATLAIVVRQCRKRKWLSILIVWIAAEVINALILKGARTGLVLFLMAAALLYHRMIKSLSMKFLISAGALLFIFFIFLGIYRSYSDFISMRSDLSQVEGGLFSGANEFQVLLGTAYDVLQRKENGVYLPWYLYINDIINVLPPQQIMPFEKVSASFWYMKELGVHGMVQGHGKMWGVITQSIVGLDWIELSIRGAILGFILARLHRWYLKNQFKFFENIVYIFFCLKVYYTFRDTTFSLLTNLVWEILPFFIFLVTLKAILPQKKRNRSIRNFEMTSVI